MGNRHGDACGDGMVVETITTDRSRMSGGRRRNERDNNMSVPDVYRSQTSVDGRMW